LRFKYQVSWEQVEKLEKFKYRTGGEGTGGEVQVSWDSIHE